MNEDNPLLSDALGTFDRLIEAVGPAAMLVLVRARMGPALLQRLAPEDIWQETLLHAWRDRARCEWRGLSGFRRWLLQLAENRIRDARDREMAEKRGAGREMPFSTLQAADASSFPALPAGIGALVSTSPSKLATLREQADCIEKALGALEPEQGEVVRLRLIEDLSVQEIASRLGIGPDAVRHRLRTGARTYRHKLAREFETRAEGPSASN